MRGAAARNAAVDTKAVDALATGYADNNLQRHEEKHKRRVAGGRYYGCRTHGILGRTLAPQGKTLAQILLTVALLTLGVSPLLLCQHVMGGWIFVLQFRRSFFSPLRHIFKI